MRKIKNFIFICSVFVLFSVSIFIFFTNKSDTEIIPVLTYHNIEPSPSIKKITYSIDDSKFEKHIKKLKEMGYNTIVFSDLEDRDEKTEEIRTSEQKNIMITSDDGKMNNYLYMYPAMEKYSMRGNLFIIGRKVDDGDEEYMGKDEIKTVLDSGLFEIGSHSFNLHHKKEDIPVICRMDGETEDSYRTRIYEDISMSKELLEDRFETEITAFAYPYGVSTEESAEILEKIGIENAFTTDLGITPEKSEDERYIRKRINVDGFCSERRLIFQIELFKRIAVLEYKLSQII